MMHIIVAELVGIITQYLLLILLLV